MWVVNNGSNTVTKLRANDGANLGDFAVGVSPWGVAFDGANIWVSNTGSNSVTELRASDGSNPRTFQPAATRLESFLMELTFGLQISSLTT